MTGKNTELSGLTGAQVKKLREKYGANELTAAKKENFFFKVLHIICEPMFLLLIIAAVIYFILGEPTDGAIMLIFVIGIISIDVIQEWKTDKTLNALKDLSAPHVKVIRDGSESLILSRDLVPGDLMIIYEGVKVPADGIIIKSSDLCVDESSLTGEAEGVWKSAADEESGGLREDGEEYFKKDCCYAGTLVTQGTAVVRVKNIGQQTEYGKIGKNVAEAPQELTPLQKQTKSLVKLCAVIAAVLFVLVGVFTYMNISGHLLKDRIIESILSGITLAMAMIPEEFPVILTVFLSMGAWRLARKKSLVRKLPSVETLGAVSVLCVDKTGTITMNKMTVSEVWENKKNRQKLCETMGMACEIEAYDPMEKAMLAYCAQNGIEKENLFAGELIKEYAFTNELKMMGHVWKKDGCYAIACKGSPEKITEICRLSEDERDEIGKQIRMMSEEGLRVIAVAGAEPERQEDIPENITDCKLELYGLVGLSDPPRPSVRDDIRRCQRAGIRVVMITGDNGITAAAIARKTGIENCGSIITGDMLSDMSDEELCERVKTTNIFSRVVPEHKMRIVRAFKENGEIVGMTGDGVNDAPALKYADIGIAMGKRGSEVSREAADLILTDDNFSVIVDTVKDGRRIYDNIKKAVGYVFTIHIPIALSSLIAPMIGINPAGLLLLPLHVVLLELIIDPTCSIVLERQPEEKNIMERRPRRSSEKILSAGNFTKSILQGIFIFAASFGTYFYMMRAGNVETARTMGIIIIMFANLFLVQVNSSENDFAAASMKRLMKEWVMHAVNILTVLGIAVIVYTPLNGFLKLAPLSWRQMLAAFGISAVSVIWYEAVKVIKKINGKAA